MSDPAPIRALCWDEGTVRRGRFCGGDRFEMGGEFLEAGADAQFLEQLLFEGGAERQREGDEIRDDARGHRPHQQLAKFIFHALRTAARAGARRSG